MYIILFPFLLHPPDIIPRHGKMLGWIQVIEDTPWFFFTYYLQYRYYHCLFLYTTWEMC